MYETHGYNPHIEAQHSAKYQLEVFCRVRMTVQISDTTTVDSVGQNNHLMRWQQFYSILVKQQLSIKNST